MSFYIMDFPQRSTIILSIFSLPDISIKTPKHIFQGYTYLIWEFYTGSSLDVEGGIETK